MFAQLPETIQQQLKEYLERNNFPAAKRLYDDAVKAQAPSQNNLQNKLHSHKDSMFFDH